MRRLLGLLSSAFLCLLLAACQSFPLGLSEQQWNALTPQQQAEYRARQSEIDADTQRRHALEEQARAEEKRLAAERERARIEERYAHARPGDIVQVTITGGQVAFHGKRHDYEPLTFDLVRGERREVEFRRVGKRDTTRVEVALSEDGRTFFFDYPSRRRYVLVDRNWARGEEYRPPEIRGDDGHSEAIGLCIHIRTNEGRSRGGHRH